MKNLKKLVYNKYKLVFALVFISVCAGINIGYTSPVDSQWKLYKSFDRTPVKILDTEKKTYYLVHQQPFSKSQESYKNPSLTLFYSDKNEHPMQIKQLEGIPSASKSAICTAEYCVSADKLIVGYQDGAIDIVSSDGSVFGIDRNKLVEYPGEDKLRRIVTSNFSDEIFLCNDYGYAIVNARSGEIVGKTQLDKDIDAVFPNGEGLILCSGGVVYESNSMNPSKFSDFTPIKNMTSIIWCAPLNKDTFVILKGALAGSLQLSALSRGEDGDWKETELCKDTFSTRVANESLLNRYEGNFMPNKDGYLLYTSAKVWQIACNESGEAIVRGIPLDTVMSPVGSWDFKNFMTYKDRGKFLKRIAQNPEETTAAKVQWTDEGVGIRPQAPADFFVSHMAYSPNYGLMLVNHGCTLSMPISTSINPPMLNSLSKDGWQFYSYPDPDNSPAYLKGNNEMEKLWKTYINRYPITDPVGVVFDPFNQDMVIMSSSFGGICMQDVSKPDAMPIKICSPTDYLAKMPFALPQLMNQNWTAYTGLSAPRLDRDTTLWFCQINRLSGKGNDFGKLIFKYITKERRKEMYSKSFEEMKGETWLETLDVPYYGSYTSYCNALAFKHPSSKNYLIADPQMWGSGISLIDHKGTLEDNSDDVCRQLYGILDQNGNKIDFIKNYELLEDPSNGDAIVAYYNGLVSFHPSAKVSVDGYIKGVDLSETKGGEELIVPQNCQVNNATFDNYGRLWIATNNQGVICLSADRKKVEYRLNEDNSPLPSNTVYGLGWDSSRNSIMISTLRGLAEFTPDTGNAGSATGNAITIYPAKVKPGYNGHVSFRNLPLNSDICIRNRDGKVVKRLSTGISRFLTWDLCDTNGNRIEAGVYTVSLPDSTEQELIVSSEY